MESEDAQDRDYGSVQGRDGVLYNFDGEKRGIVPLQAPRPNGLHPNGSHAGFENIYYCHRSFKFINDP